MNQIYTIVLSALGSSAVLVTAFFVPAIRDAVTQYISSFVQSRFDTKLETLRHEFKLREEKLTAELRAAEQRVQSLSDASLSLRSSRQMALDARRLQAVEKLWAAKVATDKLRTAAAVVAALNAEEAIKATGSDQQALKEFADVMDKAIGFDPKSDVTVAVAAAMPERPFLPINIWALFTAYQGVIMQSCLVLKVLASGVANHVKSVDHMKPAMLAALPEYKEYIEKFGFSGYYYLLDVIEQRMLSAINEFLDGKAIDDITMRRSAEIISTIRDMETETMRSEIPANLRNSTVPPRG